MASISIDAVPIKYGEFIAAHIPLKRSGVPVPKREASGTIYIQYFIGPMRAMSDAGTVSSWAIEQM